MKFSKVKILVLYVILVFLTVYLLPRNSQNNIIADHDLSILEMVLKVNFYHSFYGLIVPIFLFYVLKPLFSNHPYFKLLIGYDVVVSVIIFFLFMFSYRSSSATSVWYVLSNNANLVFGIGEIGLIALLILNISSYIFEGKLKVWLWIFIGVKAITLLFYTQPLYALMQRIGIHFFSSSVGSFMGGFISITGYVALAFIVHYLFEYDAFYLSKQNTVKG